MPRECTNNPNRNLIAPVFVGDRAIASLMLDIAGNVFREPDASRAKIISLFPIGDVGLVRLAKQQCLRSSRAHHPLSVTYAISSAHPAPGPPAGHHRAGGEQVECFEEDEPHDAAKA